MKDVFSVAVAMTYHDDTVDTASILIIAAAGIDENELIAKVTEQLDQTAIKKLNAVTIMTLNDDTLRRIGRVAQQKGLI